MLRVWRFVQCVWEIQYGRRENEIRLDGELFWVQSEIVKTNGIKIIALICLLLSSVLTGCNKSGPLADCAKPNAIRVGSQVITNEETINQVVLQFAGIEKRWKHYWDTTPATGITIGFEKNGKRIATAFIGVDWAIIVIDNSDPNARYSTAITKQEHDNLFRLLGLQKN
jgi:hypothetical protein